MQWYAALQRIREKKKTSAWSQPFDWDFSLYMLRHNIQAYVKTQECAEQRPHASFYNSILIRGAKQHAGKFYKQCDSSTCNIDMTKFYCTNSLCDHTDEYAASQLQKWDHAVIYATP
jgi:hypothetical protein